MILGIRAACGCHTGNLRDNNEDNFWFAGEYLESQHGIMPRTISTRSWGANGWTAAVFDGMGGENFGEIASYAAAKSLAELGLTEQVRHRGITGALQYAAEVMNRAVIDGQEEMKTSRMGSTMVSISFFRGTAYICNLGDSRAYCLRSSVLTQLSRDHVASLPTRAGRKQPLTQYLGIDPEEMLLEPSIAQQSCQRGDVFLLCSDGLSDMLTDQEIAEILGSCREPVGSVDRLIAAALEHGGRDNITVIVCRIM